MKKYLIYIILTTIIISCQNIEKKEYKNGILYKSYTLNKDNEYDGLYKEFYKSGKPKIICNYEDGIIVDSSIFYFDKSDASIVAYFKKKDTLLCKTFEKNILESSGEFYNGRKIGYWNYYNKNGKITKKQEFINLCGKHYMNQSWEYDDKNKLIKDKGNHYQIFLKRKEYLVGDTINIKIIYTPMLGKDSHNLIYVDSEISSDFCNIKNAKLDNWYSDNREINSKVVFSTKGEKNLRGYIQEYLHQKGKPKNLEYLYREVYFDIPIHIK